ncbi:MAG: hypothetical protein KGI84_05695 [Elusimicrobia bacterium]|nr:hypothetical protein [Elusimicrobiota bacterium]
MSASSLLREMPRKIFHLMSLLYYIFYRALGLKRTLFWMALWTLAVGAAEAARLFFPAWNRLILRPFTRIVRPEEKERVSALFHTTLGSLLAFAFFGKNPQAVAFALGCAALGDAAAALGGKALGRHAIGPGKTLEGTLSCLAACLGVGLFLGLGWAPSLFAAAAATAVEYAPVTPWFNDNLWMPLVAAAALQLALRK